MALTIVVTRNLPGRFKGFLASCLLELSPGVFVAPKMKKSVRERIWTVMEDWAGMIPQDGGVLVVWNDKEAPSGLNMQSLGWPKKDFINKDGMWLTVNDLREDHDIEELESLSEYENNGKKEEFDG